MSALPLAVVELKETSGANTSTAYNQIYTYLEDISYLLRISLFNVISEGVATHLGTLLSSLDRYMGGRKLFNQPLACWHYKF